MLSYRHAFHSGNHADILKHIVLIEILEYMKIKETAFRYIDTHSGAGMYSLNTGFAAQNCEYESGISRIMKNEESCSKIASFLSIIKKANETDSITKYPGSPWIAKEFLRAQDDSFLFELHPSDYDIVEEVFARDNRFHVQKKDGFANLKALLPPPSKRALTLIDPSYEVKADYERLIYVINDSLKRFETGTYAIWYPMLAQEASLELPDNLIQASTRPWLKVELQVKRKPSEGRGMYGSGMFIINPPWTLEARMIELMPWLLSVLKQTEGGSYCIQAST